LTLNVKKKQYVHVRVMEQYNMRRHLVTVIGSTVDVRGYKCVDRVVESLSL
jgi:hypothetical protein